MRKRERGLLREIELGVLDETKSLTTILQKCIILGGRANSRQLRDWASRELKGYGEDEEIPRFRRVPAIICLDVIAINGTLTGQQISVLDLPPFAREHVGDDVRFGDGVARLERLARGPNDEPLKLTLPGSGELIKWMNGNLDGYKHITRLYWVVSRTDIATLLVHIRTSLAEMVAEMTAEMPDDQEVPPKEVADQAVNFMVTGERHNITFVNSQASQGDSAVETPQPAPPPEGWFTRWRKRGLAVGIATVIGAIAAVVTWLDWAPWK